MQLPTAGHEPALLQEIKNLPDCDDFTFGLLDYSGEYFGTNAAADGVLADRFYQPDNQLFVFVISPGDLVSNAARQEFLPENALRRVIDTLTEHGEKSSDKSLLVVITKGDRLLKPEMQLPEAAKTILTQGPKPQLACQLLEVSKKLQIWATDGPARNVLGNFAATACTISNESNSASSQRRELMPRRMHYRWPASPQICWGCCNSSP